EAEAMRFRERAARAIQSVFAAYGFPEITDAEVEAATYGLESRDLPDRDRAEAILGMQRQRVSADYLQTSAIIDPSGDVSAAVNDPNRYTGPGTGYHLDGERRHGL